MSSLELSAPIFQFKQSIPNPDEQHGLLRLRLGPPGRRWLSTYYTRMDQALLLWGVVTAVIFLTAQFTYLDWRTQALFWSTLTLVTTGVVLGLTWHWVTVKNMRWVVATWSCLMLVGLSLTDYGIFTGQGVILRHLCPGWLGLCALGYLVTSVGMQSRALRWIGLLHLSAIAIVMLIPAWQFLLTGIIMSGSLWILGLLQWDHR